MTGKVYLIPNTLGDTSPSGVLPEKVFTVIQNLDYFIVENIRNARRFIIRCGYTKSIDDIQFFELNKHTSPEDISNYLDACKEGIDMGIISEAGVPGVADPGAEIVALAHHKGIQVIPLAGPSSILMSLMASGLNGQNFCFQGYLPVKTPERIRRIGELEKIIGKHNQTQIFIETPYRNNALLDDLLRTCQPKTRLCIACDLSLDSEFIRTGSVADWKKNKPDLHKRPCVFLLGK